MSNLDELLAAAVRHFEEGCTVVDGLPCFRSDDPAYSYRWANADKLSDTVTAGWTLVTPLQERKVGTTQFGTPLYAYRYRILKEEHAARTAKAAAKAIDQVAARCSKNAVEDFRERWRTGKGFSRPDWMDEYLDFP